MAQRMTADAAATVGQGRRARTVTSFPLKPPGNRKRDNEHPSPASSSIPQAVTKGQSVKFVSKPVEIEAVHLNPNNLVAMTDGAQPVPHGLQLSFDNKGNVVGIACHTRQGVVEADVGDWAIQESDGSGCYPCKADVFAAKYQPLP
jgi:hypothetical protein